MSPVIGTILMVVLAVALGATVYVWTSGFSSGDDATETAPVRVTGFDTDDDAADDWIRLVLVRGDNAPYGPGVARVEVLAPGGSVIVDDADASTHYLCTQPSVALGTTECATGAAFFAGDGGDWAPGDVLYIPCQTDGQHQVTVSLRGDIVTDVSIRCNEAA